MNRQFDKIVDTPKERFLKIWRKQWFVRAYKALRREFCTPTTMPIRFPMDAREFELNRIYYAKLGEQKQ